MESHSLSPDLPLSQSPQSSNTSLEILQLDSDHQSALSDAESELSEALDDVPAFESEKGLLKWLEVGKTKLQSILSKMHPRSPGDLTASQKWGLPRRLTQIISDGLRSAKKQRRMEKGLCHGLKRVQHRNKLPLHQKCVFRWNRDRSCRDISAHHHGARPLAAPASHNGGG